MPQYIEYFVYYMAYKVLMALPLMISPSGWPEQIAAY